MARAVKQTQILSDDWSPLEGEASRKYVLSGGQSVTIANPTKIRITDEGQHVVSDASNQVFEIPSGWLYIVKKMLS